MKIWFDTEFIDDGKTIDLISIGMVREDGATYYAQSADCDLNRANEWLKDNVFPLLSTGSENWISRTTIARNVREFAGDRPEFWAYYSDYDWVALCQLYGSMNHLPERWPMFCLDLQQLVYHAGNPKLPAQTTLEHHALNDALWTRDAYLWLRDKFHNERVPL